MPNNRNASPATTTTAATRKTQNNNEYHIFNNNKFNDSYYGNGVGTVGGISNE
jgi:hypothetical protein